MRWTQGALGTTYKKIKPAVAHLNSGNSIGEDEIFYTWKALYYLELGKNYAVIEEN